MEYKLNGSHYIVAMVFDGLASILEAFEMRVTMEKMTSVMNSNSAPNKCSGIEYLTLMTKATRAPL